MATIEERAYNTASAEGYVGLARQHIIDACVEMAKEQKAIDIKKACNAYCIESCGHPRANCDCMSRMNIEKAMEE